MPTLFAARMVGIGSPLRANYDATPITPNDSADIPTSPAGPVNGACVGVYVGGAGTVVVQTWAGLSITITAAPAGAIVDVGPIKRVLATGTTATLIQALYGVVSF